MYFIVLDKQSNRYKKANEHTGERQNQGSKVPVRSHHFPQISIRKSQTEQILTIL